MDAPKEREAVDRLKAKPVGERTEIESAALILWGIGYDEVCYDVLAELAQLQAIATAAQEYIKVATFREANDLCYHCGADENMQHSKLCYYEQTRNKLAAALAALEQETK